MLPNQRHVSNLPFIASNHLTTETSDAVLDECSDGNSSLVRSDEDHVGIPVEALQRRYRTPFEPVFTVVVIFDDSAALERLRESFNTSKILDAVNKVDNIRYRIDDLRDKLLKLHTMAHELINGAGSVGPPPEYPIWELAEEISMAISEWPEDLEAVRLEFHVSRPHMPAVLRRSVIRRGDPPGEVVLLANPLLRPQHRGGCRLGSSRKSKPRERY
jgi:hypothetical protein